MIDLFFLLLLVDSLFPLWVIVIFGGVVSLGLTGYVAYQQKGTATKAEMHAEVEGLEHRVNERFEKEREIARDANTKIYNRLNDCAKGVTRVEAKMEQMEKMISKLVDKQLNG